MKIHFFIKLIPPRPSFAQDMTSEERQLMQRHIAYWTKLAETGIALLFGPVADPAGSYGIGVVGVERAEQVSILTANDPVASSGCQFKYEAYAMPQLIVSKSS